MENHHVIPLHLFLFLFLTMLTTTLPTTTPPPITSPSPSSSSSTPTQQLNNIIDALIGAGDFTTWLSILSGAANASLLPVTATLFVPRDTTVHPPPPDPFLFPYHVVPQRLTFSDLLLLPQHARLPTLLHGKSISVTDNSATNFSLDATPLILPDLFTTANLALHGVERSLDYSLFGDGIPPPPPSPPQPFLPIGDAIGTAWKSGGSCSRVNDVVLLLVLLLCLVLCVLLFSA